MDNLRGKLICFVRRHHRWVYGRLCIGGVEYRVCWTCDRQEPDRVTEAT